MAVVNDHPVVDHIGLQDVGAVGTSNLHPEPLVLKGDVLGTIILDNMCVVFFIGKG